MDKVKAVVEYFGDPVIVDWNDDPNFKVAYLDSIRGHPKLGDCKDVRTSRIRIIYFDDTIETDNTIYKRARS
jgi:hypothetical protein